MIESTKEVSSRMSDAQEEKSISEIPISDNLQFKKNEVSEQSELMRKEEESCFFNFIFLKNVFLKNWRRIRRNQRKN